jgi:hypothetical protein
MDSQFETPCNICCHDTINAMTAVVYYAKLVRMQNPNIDSALLDAAIERLNKSIKKCRK